MKRFFDVFPTLHVKSDLKDYFSETEVERLTTNKEHTRIKVVLHSDHLIHKSRVFRMQDEISRQVFKERSPEVYIDEHYSLSAQYTPRRLMDEYRDSLVSEIGSFSHVMGLYFREARVEYEGEESIHVIMEDSCLSRKLSFQLEEALNRIFRERCGVTATLTVELEEKKKKKKERILHKAMPLQGAEAAFTIREGEGQELPPWDRFRPPKKKNRPQSSLSGRKKIAIPPPAQTDSAAEAFPKTGLQEIRNLSHLSVPATPT